MFKLTPLQKKKINNCHPRRKMCFLRKENLTRLVVEEYLISVHKQVTLSDQTVPGLNSKKSRSHRESNIYCLQRKKLANKKNLHAKTARKPNKIFQCNMEAEYKSQISNLIK